MLRFSAPNKHHFLVDFTGFDVDGLTNNGEVFIAADRPYGLIEAQVGRDDAPPAGDAWLTFRGSADGDHHARCCWAACPCRAGPTTSWPASRTPTGRRSSQRRTKPPASSPTRSSTRRCRATPGSGSAAARSRSRSSRASTPPRATPQPGSQAGNAAYEQRFDRVFLIRAAGRSAEEILAELDRRLENDDATERAETVDNLRQITALRLEQAL